MKLTLKAIDSEASVVIHLSDERRSLANFLSILDAEKIETLEICDLTENKLPRNFQQLTNLKSLSFVRCHTLQALPAEISRCPQIEALAFIKCADLHDMSGIEKLGNLRILHISGCESFDELPEEIGQLESLQALDLSYSEGIRWISLDSMPPSLRLLDLHGCWQCDFNDRALSQLNLVSLQIQDLARIEDLEHAPVISDLRTQLRHSLAMRDGCGLDA